MNIEKETAINDSSLNDVSGGTGFPPENPVGFPPDDPVGLPPVNPVGLPLEDVSKISGGSEEEGVTVCQTCHKKLHSAEAIESCRNAGHKVEYYPTVPW